MTIQLQNAKDWRLNVLMKELDDKDDFPNLTICATNTVPTVNQILRRRKDSSDQSLEEQSDSSSSSLRSSCTWEYDYVSGRSVEGDGRIDFAKAFPEIELNMKKIPLDSLHAKQMCWEDSGKIDYLLKIVPFRNFLKED